MTSPVFIPGVNVFGVTLVFQKDHAPTASQQRGNHDWQDEVTVEDCVPAIGAPLTQTYARGADSTQTGSVFVPRDSGVTDNMRFFYQGTWFGVVGDPQWNYDHALTRENYGYVEFTARKGG